MSQIISYAAAFPSLRMNASEIKKAWRSLGAKGLNRKTVCAFDEDPITLATQAAVDALASASLNGEAIDAIFVGSTTLPYEEKPSSATLATALTARRNVRVVEIRGSCQAGLQALVAAMEYCKSNEGKRALAVATDSPMASIDRGLEHAMSAAAAAFIVGSGDPVAVLDQVAATTKESFGGRMRRHGEALTCDLELRTDDDMESIKDLANETMKADTLAIGLGLAGQNKAAKTLTGFGALKNPLWPNLGDAGAALAAVELCAILDAAQVDESVIAVAVGGGTTAIRLRVRRAGNGNRTEAALAEGREINYMEYLKHRRILSGTGASL